MPNQPKTPNRVIRVPDDLWEAAKAQAKQEDTDVSSKIRAFLREWTGLGDRDDDPVTHRS